jgi:hypothetical protein
MCYNIQEYDLQLEGVQECHLFNFRIFLEE